MAGKLTRYQSHFIGIGAQRSGTSWLYENLMQHPSVVFPVKETHFFSREYNWSKGISSYWSIYEKMGERDLVTGELSTSYLYSKNAIPRIYEWSSDVKIILSIRDRTSRTISAFFNYKLSGEIPKGSSFSEAIKLKPDIIDFSLYGKYLDMHFETLSRMSLFIFRLERATGSSQAILADIYDFIGIDSSFISKFSEQKINSSKAARLPLLERIIFSAAEKMKAEKYFKLISILKYLNVHNFFHFINSRKITQEQKISLRDEVDKVCQEMFKNDQLVFDNTINKLEKMATSNSLKVFRL
jgi:hypothetical protein